MRHNTCNRCKKEFPTYLKIDGKWRSCNHRKFCFECSPFGTKDRRHPDDRIKDRDGCRTCSRCKKRLPLDSEHFSTSKKEKSGFRWLCKQCASKRVIERQQEQKKRWVEYKGGKCEICGYDKCVRSLHFHHKVAGEKDFTLSKYKNRSWAAIKQELDKTILVCANCHGEIHSKSEAEHGHQNV